MRSFWMICIVLYSTERIAEAVPAKVCFKLELSFLMHWTAVPTIEMWFTELTVLR
jgi:hypothetical protein